MPHRAPGTALHQPLAEIRQTLDVNVLGAIATVQAFRTADDGACLPKMPGRVVAISSVSGRSRRLSSALMRPPSMRRAPATACARKLMIHGIDVVMIEPGPIATPIWRKSAAGRRYEDTAYRDLFAGMSDYIARVKHPRSREARRGCRETALTARRPPRAMRSCAIRWSIGFAAHAAGPRAHRVSRGTGAAAKTVTLCGAGRRRRFREEK